MIISKSTETNTSKLDFFRINRNKIALCTIIFCFCSSGGALSGTPARPSQAWPTGHIRKITGISPPLNFFSNQISTKSTFRSRLKIVKKCYLRGSFDDVRHFFTLNWLVSPLFGIGIWKCEDFTRFFGGFWASVHRRQRVNELSELTASAPWRAKNWKTPAGSL